MTAKKPVLTYHPWMTTAGGRKFLLVVYLTISDQVLVWFGKISGEAYGSIILGVVAVFVAGNAYIKTKAGSDL